eukprot:s204_g18.t1
MKVASAPSCRPSLCVSDFEDSPGIGSQSTRDSRAGDRFSSWKSRSEAGSVVVTKAEQRKIFVRSFLESNGFMHVNEAKSRWGKTCYPLHTAVRLKKSSVVKALLQLGARRDVKYRGFTPEEYAQKKHHRWGGYEDVLKIFQMQIPSQMPSREECEATSEDSTEIPEDEEVESTGSRRRLGTWATPFFFGGKRSIEVVVWSRDVP